MNLQLGRGCSKVYKYIPIIALVIVVIVFSIVIMKQQDANQTLIEALMKKSNPEVKKTQPVFNKDDFFKINLN
jgi:hypothetical protein